MFLGEALQTFFKKGDMFLLSLCLLASGIGLALIYSATRWSPELESYPAKQLIFIVMGIIIAAIYGLNRVAEIIDAKMAAKKEE